MNEQQRDYVLRSVEERGVRLIRLWFTDVLGNLKSMAITPPELDNALNDGMTFDGSSIDGFSRVQEADVLAIPDPDTYELLPWADGSAPEARIFCDIHHLDGTPFEGDPRQILRRHVKAAHEAGLSFYLAPDIEYFYFEPLVAGAEPVPIDDGGFFDHTINDVTGELRKQTIRTLETMGIPVEYSFHEDAPGQQEIDLRHTDALTMADSVMTFRLAVREIAAATASTPRSCPSRSKGLQGSGMHVHMSLFRGDDNAFYDEGDDYDLSATAKHFMAGLLRHAREITAVTNQTVNSYKRLVPNFEAPVHISWARNNRSGLIRVPIAKQSNPLATDRVPLPRPCVQPVPRVQPAPRRRHEGDRGAVRVADEADANLFEARRRTREARRRPSSRTHCTTRSRSWSSRRSSARHWASTSSSGSCATSDESGRATRPRSPRSNGTAT